MLISETNDRSVRGYCYDKASYRVVVKTKDDSFSFSNLSQIEQAGLFYILASVSYEDLLEICYKNLDAKRLLAGLVHHHYNLGSFDLSHIPDWQSEQIDDTDTDEDWGL